MRARQLAHGNEPFLSKQQLAEHFAFSVRWVEYRVAEGMPHVRLGGRLRFRTGECEAWLLEREAAR
jgi:hypothetical protein